MKKVKLKKTMADENGCYSPGAEVWVSPNDAADLVDAGAAEYVADKGLFPDAEFADVQPRETASNPQGRLKSFVNKFRGGE